jgi:hypothetical protein
MGLVTMRRDDNELGDAIVFPLGEQFVDGSMEGLAAKGPPPIETP